MGEEAIDIDALLAQQAADAATATISMPTKLNFAEVLVERDEEEGATAAENGAAPSQNGTTEPDAKKESAA